MLPLFSLFLKRGTRIKFGWLQVMYIKGCVPGEVGEILLVKDCLQPSKRVKNPPFPTFFPPDQTADSSKEAPEEVEVPAAPNAPVVAPNGEIFASKLFRYLFFFKILYTLL